MVSKVRLTEPVILTHKSHDSGVGAVKAVPKSMTSDQQI